MTDPKSQSVATLPKRQRTQVEAKLERKLMTYAVAAGAAGVSVLAIAQPVEGRVVFTAVNSEISPAFALDLNHDGVVDFNLIRWGGATSSARLDYLNVCHSGLTKLSHQCVSSSFGPNSSNLVRTTAAGGAAALPFGANIGPGQQWGGKAAPELMGEVIGFHSVSGHTSQEWRGAWANGGKGVANKYLGLKFKIGNMFHYGWARVTFLVSGNSYTATITGYAYETIPGQSIRAGYTSGTAEVGELQGPGDLREKTSSQQASLGLLASGSSGLSIWRRDEAAN